MLIRRRIASAALALGLAGAGTAAALASTAAPAGAATADGGPGTVAYCQSIMSLFPGLTMGDCVSYYNSHDRSAAATDVYFCKTEFVPDGYFANLGQCVSYLNQFKGT
jgi:hypothetical protein